MSNIDKQEHSNRNEQQTNYNRNTIHPNHTEQEMNLKNFKRIM